MSHFKDPLSEELKEQLLDNDRLFKIYVIEKFENQTVCEKHIVKNNIRWLKGLVGGLYTIIIGAAVALIFNSKGGS